MLMNILFGLLGLVAVMLIAALFMRKKYCIQSEIIIHRPQTQVFEYVRLLKNQDHYNKWVMTDPNMNKIFKGTDGTVGFIYGWNGNKRAGEGEQEITEIEEGVSIDTEIRFVRPFKGLAKATIRTESLQSEETKVVWINESTMMYPMNLMISTIEKMLAKDMDFSLSMLKGILEQKQAQS